MLHSKADEVMLGSNIQDLDTTIRCRGVVIPAGYPSYSASPH